MTNMTHSAFFGDAQREFRITPELIIELERKTGAGIGSLCNRLFAREFKHADITEVIRLGLIGGGTAPAEAANLVNVYAVNRPVMETYPLAVDILETLMFGKTKDDVANG